ncbi:MAG: hypothetical protein LBD42_03240 [Desulfovibrio sp.]|jgi:hypothetical protein|nr:hypothetical protein [Desulfovibrio sp.]
MPDEAVGYHENDAVRVTRALAGKDPYTGEPVSVPAFDVGAVIAGSPGSSSYDVEFVLSGNKNDHSAVLIVRAEDLEPYRESATV